MVRRHTSCGGEDYEAGPVVFDEFAHFDGVLRAGSASYRFGLPKEEVDHRLCRVPTGRYFVGMRFGGRSSLSGK